MAWFRELMSIVVASQYLVHGDSLVHAPLVTGSVVREVGSVIKDTACPKQRHHRYYWLL
jgi:hypothetical protein